MIPLELRDFETYLVSYSGGKDSTATLLWALENLPLKKIRVVFADTTVEWPETYEYLDYIEERLGVTIDRIQAGDRALPPLRNGKPRQNILAYETSFYSMVRRRGMWPGAKYRFCTTYLKHYPLRLYAQEFPNPVQIEGSRREESKKRALRPAFDKGGNKTGIPIYRPVLDWSERRVWDCLRTHHILPNAVYNHATRCGCWCCIMGRPAEVMNFCRLHPGLAQEAADLEREIGHSWRDRYSIGNLLVCAQAQAYLFKPAPRFRLTGE